MNSISRVNLPEDQMIHLAHKLSGTLDSVEYQKNMKAVQLGFDPLRFLSGSEREYYEFLSASKKGWVLSYEGEQIVKRAEWLRERIEHRRVDSLVAYTVVDLGLKLWEFRNDSRTGPVDDFLVSRQVSLVVTYLARELTGTLSGRENEVYKALNNKLVDIYSTMKEVSTEKVGTKEFEEAKENIVDIQDYLDERFKQ